MKFSDRVKKVIETFVSKFYTGSISKIAARLGVETYLKKGFFGILVRLSDEIEVSVSDQSAQFKVETEAEYMRYYDIMGEEEVIKDFLEQLRENDVFYDIGANTGVYTCLAGGIIGQGAIHSFEPHPGNANRLRENIRLNDTRAEVHEVALGDTNTEGELEISAADIGAGAHSLVTNSGGGGIPINIAMGDEYIASTSIESPTVVKIDIEGGEFAALKGLRKNLQRYECRLIYCEVHPSKLPEFNANPEDVKQLLTEAGFDVTKLHTRDEQYFLRGAK